MDFFLALCDSCVQPSFETLHHARPKMSRMIFYLQGSLRWLGAAKPTLHCIPPHPHRPPPLLLHFKSFGLMATQVTIGNYFLRGYATNPPLPPPPPSTKPESEDNQPMTIIQGEIRAQERLFQVKLQRTGRGGDLENVRKINASHLEDNVKLEMLRGSTTTPPFGSETEAGQEIRNRLFFDPNRVSQIFGNFTPESTTTTRRPAGRIQPVAVPKPREIIYPKNAERVQVNFKLPTSATLAPDKELLEKEVSPPPPPPTGPRFIESTTHRLKVQHATPKPQGDVTNDTNLTSRLLNLTGKQHASTSSTTLAPTMHATQLPPELHSTPPIPPPPSTGELFKLDVDVVHETQMITQILTKQDLRVVALDGGRLKKTDENTSQLQEGQELNPDSAGEDDNKSSNAKNWMRVKYTLGLMGILSGIFTGYLLIFVGPPKYDKKGNLIPDKYSHLPIQEQYYYRIKDELITYDKIIKEPSRDKLLPDALVPPYYQPPYTLVLEFTDLLVHPEWTRQEGWRFKKRPGLDQFLESLYTRFEVVVYTAQVGMTVFPIIDALDGRNLISYKLVRDATNFIDGDHVKDLDRINRDLSRVVVVDWNAQSVKLHKENLFQIPRWDGNDEDFTLYDLAAFLIAISEWEIQDVRTVLEYYAQFDNPLAKFKENQMQALQAS